MPKSTGKSQTKRKYRIASVLAAYDSEVASAKRAEIREACGINNRSTLSEWENIPADSNRMIPFDFAIQICRILGIKPFEFINT